MLTHGVIAPSFQLAATGSRSPLRSADFIGRRLVLIFLPEALSDGLIAALSRYAGAKSQFADLRADLMAISPASVEQLYDLAGRYGVDFPLLSDPTRAVASAYRVCLAEGQIQPTVYIIDENGSIAAAFDPERYPDLPTPTAVTRALRRLNDVLRPPPPSADDWRLGPADARVTLIAYSDYQCPHCRALHELLLDLEEVYGARIAVIHRHLPLRHTHPMAQLAAEAAEAAGAQGQFWPMHHRLFTTDDALTRERVLEIAADLGLDMARFVAELDGHVYEAAVNDDFKRAVAVGVKLPPMLFINGVLYEGPRSAQALREYIEARLAE